jgi:hypothetical protein
LQVTSVTTDTLLELCVLEYCFQTYSFSHLSPILHL